QVEARCGQEGLAGRGLHPELPVQVEAVQVQVVDGGKGAQAVEAQAEAGVGAEEHGLQPRPQGLGGEDLRQGQRRVGDEQHVAPLQRADVDGHQGPGRAGAGAAQAEEGLLPPDLAEVELPRVEALPDAADLLGPPPLRRPLDVQLGHQPQPAREAPRREPAQAVAEQAPPQPLGPAFPQRPVEARPGGVDGRPRAAAAAARPLHPAQHQLLRPVGKELGALCRIFSTAEPGEAALSFEDFLDLLSVFSDSATPEVKSHYAFRLFDFDDDGTLDKKDLEKLVNSLTGEGEDSRLSLVEMEQLIQNILEESDIDKDGTINLSEFQHIISRSPDFTSSFKIVL
uniref:Calcium and integrin binding 1 n=1 Tax=Pseudonaja textilis TaxID=8673 RepID=A0A670ZHM1_PSETE